MIDPIDAIAQLRQNGPQELWTATLVSDGHPYPSALAGHVATVLNAAATGTMIPATERDAAVAAALEDAVSVARKVADRFRSMMSGITLADASYRLAEAKAAAKCVEAILDLITQPQADALARVRAEAVKVKPLVWSCIGWASGDGVEGENDDTWSAPSGFDATYQVDWYGSDNFRLCLPDDSRSTHTSLAAAKAAAQADYDARIRAAIGGVE